MQWFDVDRAGLGKLLERRGKSFVGAELLQNAWDAEGVTRVEFSAEPVKGRPLVDLVVKDDSPHGFHNLAHSFTLFSESVKKSNASLRGRFNLGEKLVLALCESATIASTTGTIAFNADGRASFPRRKTEAGTEFRAQIRMTRDELTEMLAFVRGFIPPAKVQTLINGEHLFQRQSLRGFQTTLPTELADENGVLRRSARRCSVNVYVPLPGQPARIYELGIPIVETGDLFDVDIGQKVPLSLERDSVTPAYLRDVRAAVLSHTSDLVPKAEAAAPWINDAIEDEGVSSTAVADVLKARYGEKMVSYDPSDREANDRAVALGYAVIHGGAFSGQAWTQIRAAGVQPAGRVTPTPKPFSDDGEPAKLAVRTPAMDAFAEFCKTMARELLDAEISVTFYKRFNAAAAYAPGSLYFCMSALGEEFFEGPLNRRQLDLLIHEFGHHREANHLSRNFSDALSEIGARTALLAIERPHLFDLDAYAPEANPSAPRR
ncbi:hypothetical protein [Bosea sp. ANAM02]|uniref:hypothetical protein n=1 Tax=Bosea sp. ANAM02 TaxID=2020412 RepID=UPI00140ED7AB|nr:hypothetical protein [Bosea sp. ANAM02]BCB21934.1 hypothetical protein OCUBac02_48280 [Bosea sp. ANAM02]